MLCSSRMVYINVRLNRRTGKQRDRIEAASRPHSKMPRKSKIRKRARKQLENQPTSFETLTSPQSMRNDSSLHISLQQITNKRRKSLDQ
jgi:hypothetical protein